MGTQAAQATPTTQATTHERSATTHGTSPSVRVIDYVSVVKAAYAAYQAYASRNELSLEEATQRILNSIDSAKTQILSHIDQVATAEARACARQSVIDFADITRFTTDTLQAFARDTTGCVTRIDSLLATVSDKAAVDQLGFAANAVGPISLVARARAGFQTAGLKGTLVNAHNAITAGLEPRCVTVRVREPGLRRTIIEEQITCTAYNGHTGWDSRIISPGPPGPRIDVDALKLEAASGTSWVAAKAVLPVLQS
ncbi:hypothetical protein AB0945_14805 [Streptomyces sp. NPDC005474]|uniref:hypothetical protein n=1 Tax=Streptomyces sp. NPDC005474 TaxID=3154878 RepID=UPI0034573212